MKLNREKKEKERNDREMDAETRTFVSLLENDKLKLKDKKENVRKHIERIQNNVISKAFATYVLVTFITRLTYQRLTTYNTKHRHTDPSDLVLSCTWTSRRLPDI